MSNFRDMMSSEDSEHFMLAWDEFAPVLIKIKHIFHTFWIKFKNYNNIYITRVNLSHVLLNKLSVWWHHNSKVTLNYNIIWDFI